MLEGTEQNCARFIASRDAVKAAFPWDGAMLHLAAACIFAGAHRQADVERLEACKALLKEQVGVFSNFRSYAKVPVISMLAASDDPQRMLENGLTIYGMLKREFRSSSYLPLAAMIAAQLADAGRYDEIAAKTRRIYESMRAEHPFLTSSEDSAFCTLLALSETPEDVLIAEIERCYASLKGRFFSMNSVQSLCHVLALYDAPAEEKCDKVLQLFGTLKAAGHKYGTGYELPSLGVLAMSCDALSEAAERIIEIDEWLSQRKGFGALSVSPRIRLMYAGMLAQDTRLQQGAATAAVIGGTISAIIAQQTAICAAVAASSAAANSGN